jgi:hypothetical protein
MVPNDPGPPFYRRYWTTYNRPYSGCGCLWLIIVFFFIYWILSWIWFPNWRWWGY